MGLDIKINNSSLDPQMQFHDPLFEVHVQFFSSNANLEIIYANE